MTLDNLDERIKSMVEKGRAQKKAAGSAEPKPAPCQLLIWPEWADTRRAAPSGVFRSALFPATGRGQRKWLKDETIYSTKGLKVIFRGEQFDQTDLDVYLEILHLMRDQPDSVEFTAHGLLKALGRKTGKKDYDWLHSVIIRLTAGTVDMTDHKTRYFGHLIEGGKRDEITKKYTLRTNADFAQVFKAAWSSLDIEQRRRLKSDTAKALHAYYSGHVNPEKHLFETLAGICGLVGVNRKTTLIKAHKELEEAGYILAMDIEKDGIKIKATMTPSQARHVVKKITKKPRQ